MIDPAILKEIWRSVQTCIELDRSILQQLLEEIQSLMNNQRRIQPRWELYGSRSMRPDLDSATHCERDDSLENCGIEITEEMIEEGEMAIQEEIGGSEDLGTLLSASN